MLINNSLQREIIDILQQNEIVNMTAIFKDLIEEHKTRAAEVYGLRQRGKLKAASSYYDFENGTNDNSIKDGIPIKARQKLNENKINHRLHNDYYNAIIQNKVGYIPELHVTGNEVLEQKLKELKINTKYIRQISDMTGWGVSYLMLYNDINANLKSTVINADETILIRNQSTDETEYAMRYWKITIKESNGTSERFRVEWYDRSMVYIYMQDSNGLYQMIDSYSHTFDIVPIFEFLNNTDGIGDCEYTIDLQDAYDIAISDLSSEITQMRLAYLVLKNLGNNVDDDFVRALINTGIISVSENGDAKFLEKNLNDEAIQNLLKVLDTNIWLFSNSYNPAALGGEQTAYEIRQKLKRLTDSCNETIMLYKDTFSDVLIAMQSWYKKWKNETIDLTDINITIPYREPKNVEVALLAAKTAGAKLATSTIIDVLGLPIDAVINEQKWNEEYMQTGLTNASEQRINTTDNQTTE